MARAKKTRKSGSIGTPKSENSKVGSRRPAPPPRSKKKSGNAPGTRNKVEANEKPNANTQKPSDKRLGSKKPIPLVVSKPAQKSNQVKKRKYATPAEELAALEANDRFNRLLDLLEDEQSLNQEDKTWLDEQLARHKILCDLLGIKEEPESENDDPFAQLDAIQLDDFKD